jgi:hypothetical protein
MELLDQASLVEAIEKPLDAFARASKEPPAAKRKGRAAWGPY